MTRLPKLTDLFAEGRVCPVTTPAGDTLPLWINKLSPFEMEQANHEGRVARARTILAIRTVGTPDYQLFEANAQGLKPDAMIHGLLASKANEHLVKAIRDLHADAEWKENLETLDWSGDQVKGKAQDDPEVQALGKLLTDYQAELDKRTGWMADELREELRGLPLEALREMYLDAYVEEQGLRSYTREQQKTVIFYALRRCNGRDHGEHTWTHEDCDHAQRWLENPADVDALPQALLEAIRKAHEALNMAPDVARFLGGPASSSASHGPSSTQEASSPSTPEETSAAPAGTSSSPSPRP